MRRSPVRAELDTNVLVSALLLELGQFEPGRMSWLRYGWQQGQIIPVLAQPTARELLRVLAYPKFRLQSVDRERLLEDLLPWCETWSAAIPSSMRAQVFLDLALTAATPCAGEWRCRPAGPEAGGCSSADHQPSRLPVLAGHQPLASTRVLP